MTIDVRHGRCGRVYVTLSHSFDATAVDRLHDLLAASEPTRSIILDLRSVHHVDRLALAALAEGMHERGGRLTITGLSQRDRRLLADLARQPRS